MKPTSNRAVVLASGGLDSTVTAAIAKQEGCELFFLTMAYGQRHAVEVERARQVAAALGAVNHLVMNLDLRAIGGSALTGPAAVPKDRAGTRAQPGHSCHLCAGTEPHLSLDCGSPCGGGGSVSHLFWCERARLFRLSRLSA